LTAFLGFALIVGLFVAYFLQQREKKRPAEPAPTEPGAAAPSANDEAIGPRGSSPNWGAPILFCGFLYGATSRAGTGWSVFWQLLYFGLVALGAYTAFSAKEFAGEQARNPSVTRRDHMLQYGVTYVAVPVIAWVLAIPFGWPTATLLPALPWALLLIVGLVVAVRSQRS
jgi:hypothetical protein